MPARLVPVVPGAAPTIPLQRPVVLIGRHSECDVRIDLPQISERHCCVAQVDDRLILRDLGSKNGVRVNGQLVDEARISTRDEVAIAHVIFRVEGEVDRPRGGASPVVAPASQARPVQTSTTAPPPTQRPAKPSSQLAQKPLSLVKSGENRIDDQGPASLPDLPIPPGDTDLVPIDDI